MSDARMCRSFCSKTGPSWRAGALPYFSSFISRSQHQTLRTVHIQEERVQCQVLLQSPEVGKGNWSLIDHRGPQAPFPHLLLFFPLLPLHTLELPFSPFLFQASQLVCCTGKCMLQSMICGLLCLSLLNNVPLFSRKC